MKFLLIILATAVTSGLVGVLWPELVPWSGIAIGAFGGILCIAGDIV